MAMVIATQVLAAQTRMKPTVPGTSGDPVWQGIVRLSDGRAFVTDGGLAVDVAVAKPAKLPDREVPGKILEGFTFLRRVLPADAVRLRVGGPVQPVVIAVGGKIVGVLMPVKPPADASR
jgi:hypothetical protein